MLLESSLVELSVQYLPGNNCEDHQWAHNERLTWLFKQWLYRNILGFQSSLLQGIQSSQRSIPSLWSTCRPWWDNIRRCVHARVCCVSLHELYTCVRVCSYACFCECGCTYVQYDVCTMYDIWRMWLRSLPRPDSFTGLLVWLLVHFKGGWLALLWIHVHKYGAES